MRHFSVPVQYFSALVFIFSGRDIIRRHDLQFERAFGFLYDDTSTSRLMTMGIDNDDQ
jgi:hypothetical protein